MSVPLILLVLIVTIVLVAALRLFRRPRKPWIVVDGSNVMHWEGETPALETVARVLDVLQVAGYRPLVWFDANVGYKVFDRYMNARKLAPFLPMSQHMIMVAPSGTPADPLLLEDAIKRGARVVTCDRFRDWVEQFPQVAEAGFLVRGRVVNGVVSFDL